MMHTWPAAFLLAAALLPALVHAEDGRKQFGRWVASCSAGAYCAASTRITGGGEGYAYQLRVSRFASGNQEIVFIPATAAPAPDSPLQVSVDKNPALSLPPGSGYRRVGTSSTFVLGADAAGALLHAMSGGQQVTFAYTRAGGQPVRISFPLMGLPQALKFAGVSVPATQASAPAAAPREASAERSTQREPKKQARREAAGHAPDPASTRTAATTADAQTAAVPLQAPAAVSPPAPSVQQEAAPDTAQDAKNASHAASAVDAAAQSTMPGTSGPDGGSRPDVALKPVAPPSAAARPTAVARKRTKAVTQFACRGSEPAWSLVIDHDTARYLALQDGEPQAVPLKGKLKVTGEGRTPDVDWRGKSADGGSYKVLIQEQACADTMADASADRTTFAYRARLTLPNGKLVQGCCNAGLETVAQAQPAPAPAPAALPGAAARLDPPKLEQAVATNLDQAPVAQLFAKRPDDWSRFLLELKPAIDACLDRTPGGAAYVTKAWPMNRGLVGVRTRNGGAGWFDCVAGYDGRSVQRFAPVTADAGPVQGEGNVLYTPIAGVPLQGKCWRQERVVDGGGTPLGWLSSNGC
jgi:uncharacterized membrane protein